MKDGTAFSWQIPAEAKDPYANRDPRFYADVLYNGAPYKNRTAQFYTGGLDSKTSSLSPWNASKTGYTIRKMIDESYDFNNQEYSKCQWVVFRLAEIYLNYAEASAELGNTADALKYVNLIRKRADMPDLTAANLVDKIRQERRIELCFEGHRYFDLRRWNLAETGAGDALGIQITPTSAANTSFTYKTQVIEDRVWKPALTLYPIPRSEIQKNPNIKQNPGYK
ncbi:RagB/SusD family nutrient uptake outer membrane protein [Arachidicoccus ginsenosidivorans]|nr:RagB/SusD family nutrient uptake outer membrane protein [Arachidicoccus ginsenosidivorans]